MKVAKEKIVQVWFQNIVVPLELLSSEKHFHVIRVPLIDNIDRGKHVGLKKMALEKQILYYQGWL